MAKRAVRQRGVLHVLLEKPFTVTTEEAVEVMKAEKKSGKILSIGFQPRFDENMKMLKKVVQSGELGKIYYIQSGGETINGGWYYVYDLDQATDMLHQYIYEDIPFEHYGLTEEEIAALEKKKENSGILSEKYTHLAVPCHLRE